MSNFTTITIAPVGGEPIEIIVPAAGGESMTEFAARAAARAGVDLSTLPVLNASDPRAFAGSILAKRRGLFIMADCGHYNPQPVATAWVVESARREAVGLYRAAGMSRREARAAYSNNTLSD